LHFDLKTYLSYEMTSGN